MISTDSRLSWGFSIFYSKAVKELKTRSILNYKYNGSNDSLKEALGYFKNHPSIAIANIKRKGFHTRFTFRETNSNEKIKLSKTLNINKAC